MKVMMIETLGDGGITHYTFNLLTSLTKKRISGCLFTAANYEFLGRSHDYEVYPVMFRFANRVIRAFPRLADEKPFSSSLRRFIKLVEYPLNALEALIITKRQRIKYVHLQSVNWIEVIMISMFKLIGRKIIYTVHNVMPRHGKLRNYHRLIYWIMYRLCDRLIVHSNKGKQELSELFRVCREKIFVIPHGDYKFFVPDKTYSKDKAKEKLSIPKKCKTMLFFGAIRPNKGLEQALLALPYVRESIDNFKLLIVGELWEDYKRYEKIIEACHLEGNVYAHLEYVTNEDLPLYFFASDIVLLPYHEITQSGVLQIAYAFSKPVIATALGGFKEAIADGKNGYIVPIGDVQGFGAKIVELLSSDQRIREMGQYSRYLADTKYSWEMIAEKTKAVYSTLE